MKEISLKSFAKINLSLDVIGKKEDGYHLLKMIMQSLDLHDNIVIKEKGEGILIRTDKYYIPTDNRNLAYKAVEAFNKEARINKGIEIHIGKNIPVSAGLAGGSSNAAAVLLGMNEMFNKPISKERLLQIGLSLGADVPFCMTGGTCLCEGIGEIITPLKPFNDHTILLVKPNFGVSTKEVFKSFKLDFVKIHVNTNALIKAIENDNLNDVSNNMKNLLENVTIRNYGIIGTIKKEILRLGAIGSLMTGSGPTVFGLFKDEEKAKNAFDIFKSKYQDVFLTKTSNGKIIDN